MRKTKLLLCGASLLLSGCTIRMSAMIETEDAVYGTSKIEKVQKYDPKQHHLGVAESVMGAVNSGTLDSLGRIINGGTAPQTPALAAQPTVITPVPSGTSVLVQP